MKNTYINVSTENPTKARAFFTEIGFKINEQYSDEQGFCVIVNENTFLMVMNQERFESFTLSKPLDSTNQKEVILSFEVENQQEVDSLIEKVIQQGGKEFKEAVDLDFMYYRSFKDLDGHHFEVFNFKK